MVTKIPLSVVWVTAKMVGTLGLTQLAGNGKLTALLYRSVPYSAHTGIAARLSASKIDCMSSVVGLNPSVKQVMNGGALKPRSGVYIDNGPWFEMRTAPYVSKTTCFTPYSMENIDFCSGRTRGMVLLSSKSLGQFDSGSSLGMNSEIKPPSISPYPTTTYDRATTRLHEGWHFGNEEESSYLENGFDDIFSDESEFPDKQKLHRSKELLGSHTTLTPDEVNRILEPGYIDLRRHQVCPESAFGAIFPLDMLVNLAEGLLVPVWSDVARGYPQDDLDPPDKDQCLRALGAPTLEDGIVREFRWTEDAALAKQYQRRFTRLLRKQAKVYHAKALRGTKDLLEKLVNAGMRCAVISHLPAYVVKNSLINAGLVQYFRAGVYREDDINGDDLQSYLRASLKLQRAPNRCTVFETRPHSLREAKVGTYVTVGLLTLHPAYELYHSDRTVQSLSEIKQGDISHLFAERQQALEPELELEEERSHQRRYKTATKAATKTMSEADGKNGSPWDNGVWTKKRDKLLLESRRKDRLRRLNDGS